MYAAAGLLLPMPTSNPVNLEATVEHVMSSVPVMKEANANIKVAVAGNNAKIISSKNICLPDFYVFLNKNLGLRKLFTYFII